MNYPNTFDGLLIFSAVVGAIAGTIVGAIQYWLDRHQIIQDWKGWQSVLSFVAWYPLIWSGISVVLVPIDMNMTSLYFPSSASFEDTGRSILENAIYVVVVVPPVAYLIPKWMDRKKTSTPDNSSDQN